MRIILSFVALLLATLVATSQNARTNYTFKDVKRIPTTAVKDQQRTGTCWAFSTASFLESEAQRLGRGEHNLSEMFVVRHVYQQKCENYVRRQGAARFSEGGLAHDLLNAVRDYGIVPEADYPGRKDPNEPFNHAPVEKRLKTLCDDLIGQAKAEKLPADWPKQITAALDDIFGTLPQKITVNGFALTPTDYRDMLGIRPDDYVTLTSFTHHPFWTNFVLEIPDNFAYGTFYNVPIDDLMRCLNFALQGGHSVEWDADVSNNDFSNREGIAMIAAPVATTRTGERGSAAPAEKFISQAYRQELFDRQITQDDHLMHIAGLLEGPGASIFYAVKNSWGVQQGIQGFMNVSEAYMRLNTISFMFHKDALPLDVRQRFGWASGEAIVPNATPAGDIKKNINAAQNEQSGKPKSNIKPASEKAFPKAFPAAHEPTIKE